jgi:plasmid stability protein
MNLLIRNFPDDLNARLKKLADEHGMKLYALIISILNSHFAMKDEAVRQKKAFRSEGKP